MIMETKDKLITMALTPNMTEERLMRALQVLEGDEAGKDEQCRTEDFIPEKDAQVFMGKISRTKMWLMRKEGLPYFRIGRRIVYRRENLKNWLVKLNARKRIH